MPSLGAISPACRPRSAAPKTDSGKGFAPRGRFLDTGSTEEGAPARERPSGKNRKIAYVDTCIVPAIECILGPAPLERYPFGAHASPKPLGAVEPGSPAPSCRLVRLRRRFSPRSSAPRLRPSPSGHGLSLFALRSASAPQEPPPLLWEELSVSTNATSHRIRSISVIGGFLEGQFEFVDGLNCLIGARGTGKTTALEFIRYALDMLPSREEDPTRTPPHRVARPREPRRRPDPGGDRDQGRPESTSSAGPGARSRSCWTPTASPPTLPSAAARSSAPTSTARMRSNGSPTRRPRNWT